MIAILMSTYNGSLFIKEQIESILKQTNKEWLLYIRDDGSTDDTRMILQEYAKKNPNKIHLLRDEFMNMGAGRSFMYLLKVVDADYYMFCDQDDVWMENKIERTYSYLRELEQKYGENTAIGVFTDLTVVDADLTVLMPSLWKGDNRNPDFVYDFYKQWTNRHACMAVHRCSILRLRNYSFLTDNLKVLWELMIIGLNIFSLRRVYMTI